MAMQPEEDSPSQLIDAKVEELSDWRGATLSRLRALIKQADPEVVEEPMELDEAPAAVRPARA
jgi:hypothetical protein